jgi:hypothetical protein
MGPCLVGAQAGKQSISYLSENLSSPNELCVRDLTTSKVFSCQHG